MRAEFERVGDGAVLNNSPYDLAAAAICLEECGAVVTDAYGEPLARSPAARLEPRVPDVVRAPPPTRELHAAICAEIDAGIERLRASI